jgi:hypothetical protein
MFSAAARLRTVRRISQQESLPAPAARSQNKPSLSAKAIARIPLPTWRFLLSWSHEIARRPIRPSRHESPGTISARYRAVNRKMGKLTLAQTVGPLW